MTDYKNQGATIVKNDALLTKTVASNKNSRNKRRQTTMSNREHIAGGALSPLPARPQSLILMVDAPLLVLLAAKKQQEHGQAQWQYCRKQQPK